MKDVMTASKTVKVSVTRDIDWNTPILNNLLSSNNVVSVNRYQELLRVVENAGGIAKTLEQATAQAVDSFLCDLIPLNNLISNEIQFNAQFVQIPTDFISVIDKMDARIKILIEEVEGLKQLKQIKTIEYQKNTESPFLVINGRERAMSGDKMAFVAEQFFGGRKLTAKKRWLIDNLYYDYSGDYIKNKKSFIGNKQTHAENPTKTKIASFQKGIDSAIKEINNFIGRVLGTQKDFIVYFGKGIYGLDPTLIRQQNKE